MEKVPVSKPANAFLPRFVSRFNDRFPVILAMTNDLHQMLRLKPHCLNDVLCHREQCVIDDHSRIAFTAILSDQKHTSAILFFHMARAHFSRLGFYCRRILADNGSFYRHWLFRKIVRKANLKQRFTRPYTPRTNGKAE